MFVYLICAEFENRKLYKIGITRRSIEKRIKELKTGNCSSMYLVDYFDSKWGSKIESQVHIIYDSCRLSGEWFDLSNDDLLSFKENCKMIHDNLELLNSYNTYHIEKTFLNKRI